MLYFKSVSCPLAYFPMKVESNADSDFTMDLAIFHVFLLNFTSSRFPSGPEKFQLYFLEKKLHLEYGNLKKKRLENVS